MAHLLSAVVAGWLLVAAPVAQSAEERGQAIAVDADRRHGGFGDSTARLEMVLRSRNGDEQVRALRVDELEHPEGDRSLVVFDSPPDVRGTALLTWTRKDADDDQWLYLPAVRRVRRIAASSRSGPFMGSEFAYEDLVEDVGRFTHRWLRDESCPEATGVQGPCVVLERRPREAGSGYSHQVVWLDEQERRTLKVDYFDRRDRLLKTLVATAYERHAGRFWRAGEMLMTNHQTGRSTLLRWRDYAFGVGLDETHFRPQALTRLR